uniref:DDE_Tnp_1_7 domain-containing protein n=1 Tax=Strongyloides stercoralis TaxID=6248 RepID=A0A0K0E082_STRER
MPPNSAATRCESPPRRDILGPLEKEENMLTGINEYFRTKLFHIYRFRLKERIKTKFPVMQINSQCLENAMKFALVAYAKKLKI